MQISLTTDASANSCARQTADLAGSAISAILRVALAEYSKLAWASGSISTMSKGVMQPQWDPSFKGFGQHIDAMFLTKKLCTARPGR